MLPPNDFLPMSFRPHTIFFKCRPPPARFPLWPRWPTETYGGYTISSYENVHPQNVLPTSVIFKKFVHIRNKPMPFAYNRKKNPFLCVVIFIRFDFWSKTYSAFNCHYLPQKTITLYNEINGSYCGSSLETTMIYFVSVRSMMVFETATHLNFGC